MIALPGDVADERHRRELVAAAGEPIDLLVNNASVLGPSPQPGLADYPLAELERVYRVNVLAPLALAQLTLPHLGDGARSSTSPPTRASRRTRAGAGTGRRRRPSTSSQPILAAEHPDLRIYAVDPGDMRTEMHQQAFPGEDISDRPPPGESVPGLLRADRGRAAERPLPRGRSRAGAERQMSAGALCPRRSRRASPRASRHSRDEVRMMVGAPRHRRDRARALRDLPEFLEPGDLLVVNNSETLPAALPGRLDGAAVELRLSTPLPTGTGSSSCAGATSRPSPGRRSGLAWSCPRERSAELLARFEGSERLSVARLDPRTPGRELPPPPRQPDPLPAR